MKEAPAIQLKKFTKEDYDALVSWIDSAELLMQFAGPHLHFPLTHQQLEQNCADKNRYCYSVIHADNQKAIGHAEIFLTGTSALLGRIIIADEQLRGKGLGKKIIHLLLDISFNELQQQLAELYVFDWNTGAIKCYEQAGFNTNKSKQLVRDVNGKTWIAFNMTMEKEIWNAAKKLTL